ncbi:MAG: DMT family transporter [Bacteroidales bacterium]|nr:DMT family transporter [Bacteroidales bacterium]
MNEKAKGYIYGILAAAAYGLNPLFAVPLYDAGMDPDSVLFFRYLFAIPMVAVTMIVRGRGFRVHSREVLPLIIMGILMATSSLALFESYVFMDASIASTLLFVYPIMVTFMMAVYYKERVTAHTLLCLAMAVGGVALMYEPEKTTGLNLAGAVLVLVAALAYAIYIVGINTTRLKGLATLKVIFYVLVFGTVIFASRLYVNKQITTPAEWYQWGNLLALAFFPTVVSLACTTRAIRYIGSTPTAILGAFEPVTAVLFCVLILGETLTMQEFGGILLVILSVTLVVEGGKFTGKIVGFKKLFPKLPKDRIHK